MREYKIYKTDLWYSIYRKKYKWKLMMMQFLYWNESWGTNKTLAKIFYHKEDALSALTIMKAKDGKDTD